MKTCMFLCFHVRVNIEAQKHTCFHVNFPFSAYSMSQYITMVKGLFHATGSGDSGCMQKCDSKNIYGQAREI